MKKISFTTLCTLLCCIACFSQDSTGGSLRQKAGMKVTAGPYFIKPKVDIPVFVVGAGFTIYNFSRISNKTPSSQSYVESLGKNDVNWFDRWGVRPYSKTKDNASYIPFYMAMPSPLILFAIDGKMRKDFFKLSFLYVEAMTVTGVLYSSATGYTNRLRPMVYDAATPIAKRTDSEQKKSFFAGHVALVATSTFFMARVLADYHPDSKFKWLYYGIAGAATATTAYLRQAAGEHFPSDLLLGAAVGTLSGILTPSFHQHKLIKNQKLSIFPVSGHGGGLTAFYRL